MRAQSHNGTLRGSYREFGHQGNRLPWVTNEQGGPGLNIRPSGMGQFPALEAHPAHH
jgi:hypothetical protein